MMRRLVNNRRAKTVSLPAPVAGWNARDPLAQMKPTDAVILDNMIPQATECVMRSGCVDHVTGITGTVETLAAYSKADGSSQLFACAGTQIYDVTAQGTAGAPVVTGLSNARWQHVNMATSGGKFLYMVNGLDKPRLYNGTAWTAIDNASTPAITGVTTTSLIHVNLYQRRLWFVENASMRVWYLPVDSVGGAAASIDLSALFPAGGYLMAMGTWTIDSGSGMDDHAVFVTSEGEVAVYRGTDPASAATWALVGVYTIGAPVNRKCFVKYGSDMLIICRDGVQPLSAALQSSRVTTKVSITDRIQKAMSEATTLYGSRYGWQLQIFPRDNLLILNVPAIGGAQQFVMYTITGAWCRFTGWDASCFEMVSGIGGGDSLFFGTAGKVVKAMQGSSDYTGPINFDVLPSFQYHGGNTSKRYTLARPVISVDNPSYGLLLGLNVDYDTTAPIGIPTYTTSTQALWDSSNWDQVVWAGGQEIKKNWQTIGGIGYCAALHMKGSSASANVRWQSVDYVFEVGFGL